MNEKKTRILAARMRKWIVEEVYTAQSGHPGGSLSCTDFLATVYENYMHIDPEEPGKKDRDRLVLSKGHCAPALYAVLALKGFFPTEDLKTLRQTDSYLQGHPNMNTVPGVDMSTGSLGQGISAAVGMALACRDQGYENRIYAVLGDGECDEGQVWEASMCAAHYGLNNLCAFLDYNGLQIDGKTSDVMNTKSLASKFKSFGWHVIECDGNNIGELITALQEAQNWTNGPSIIIGHTIKGKGVSFMEGDYTWHGKAPDQEQYEQAMDELDLALKALEVE